MAEARKGKSGEIANISLGDTLELVTAAASLTEPVAYRRLLQLIIETAASVIGAETGSLFLVDEETGELAFEVALGLSDEDMAAIRLAPGEGIAGMVASTGQPVAIRNVDQDPRHAASVARKLGHQPGSVLCVPLYIDDAVVGVLELLDKRAAEGFGADDITTMALFANQAAVAIVQSRAQQRLNDLVARLTASDQDASTDEDSVADAAARLLLRIAGSSESDLRLAHDLLQVIAERQTPESPR
jgi:GAF domain-containing protein